jgi:hypothetical protein
MTSVTLYITQGCHLCELAIAEIHSVDATIQITEVEIGDDDKLTEQFGLLIPVLEATNGTQLNWPFNQQQIRTIL